MKWLIIMILLILVKSSNDIEKTKLILSIKDSLDEARLKEFVEMMLLTNTGDNLISENQTSSISDWNEINNQFLRFVINYINIYYDDSNYGKNFTNFDFKSKKELFELIFNFVLKIYKDIRFAKTLKSNIISEYLGKEGYNLKYPNWTDTEKIINIISRYDFFYDEIFETIQNNTDKSSLVRI